MTVVIMRICIKEMRDTVTPCMCVCVNPTRPRTTSTDNTDATSVNSSSRSSNGTYRQRWFNFSCICHVALVPRGEVPSRLCNRIVLRLLSKRLISVSTCRFRTRDGSPSAFASTFLRVATAKWTNQKQCTTGYPFTHLISSRVSGALRNDDYTPICPARNRRAQILPLSTLRIHISTHDVNSLAPEKETIALCVDSRTWMLQ